MIDSRHGPSFQRLYADAMNRVLSEKADWYSTSIERLPDPPAWADVVVDLRARYQDHLDMHGDACRASGGECDNGRDGPLPDLPDHPTQVWDSEMHGWTLEGFVIDRVHRRIQVLRFTDPDGFRGAFLTSGKDAKRPDDPLFEPGRFIALFPTASMSLFHAIQRRHDENGRLETGPDRWRALRDDAHACAAVPRTEVEAISTHRYRLPVLRDALKDPAGWFGLPAEEDWQTLTCPPAAVFDGVVRESMQRWLPDSMGHDCPVGPDRVLLAYAMAGVSSYEPVREFVRAGLDPAELGRLRWTADGTPTPEHPEPCRTDREALAWFSALGGGNKARASMSNFLHAGVPVAKAAQWSVLGPASHSYAGRVHAFEQAGWAPEDVLRLQRRLSTTGDNVPLHLVASSTHSYAEAATWTFTTPDAALAFLACGYDEETARAAMDTAGDPARVEAAVVTMAALRRPLTTGRAR